MNKLVLGTAQLGLNYGISNQTGQPPRDEAYAILEMAHSNNIIELDSAFAYGESHALIGDYCNQSGRSFDVYTKLLDSEDLILCFENGIKDLNSSVIKGISFHKFNDYLDINKFKYVIEIADSFSINKIGVSVYHNHEIEEVLKRKDVSFIQAPFNCFDNEQYRSELFRELKNSGIEVSCRSNFLQGLFYLHPTELKGNLKALSKDLLWFNGLKEKWGLSTEEICLGYVNSKEYIDKFVIGVNTTSQLTQNLKALKVTLPEELIREIDNYKVDNHELLLPINWK